MKKFIKDVIIKDFGKRKAKKKCSYEHKAGKRLYNDQSWRELIPEKGANT